MAPQLPLVVAVLATAFTIRTAGAAEICGNGIDDDANGLTDEGCYSPMITGQCESPLSCNETGFVAPLTGSLRHSLPPDVAPRVPWGPGIGLRRFYLSKYAPSGAAWRKPLGERWGHTYTTWLDKYTSPNRIVLHTNRGNDVHAAFVNSSGGWDYYKPQTGFPVVNLRQRTSAPNEYQLKLLTGEVMVYNSSGRLTEIWDTLATPQKVLLTYDGNGQVATVTDSSGKRRLLFGYASNVLTTVQFQVFVSSVWTTYHTTTYAYSNGHLATVTIGGQLAQTNVYTSNYLTQIQDGAGNNIVKFGYDSATAGKANLVDTPAGVIGFDYNSGRTACSGKTVLYFNRGNASTCSIDSDCGSGFLCGTKTGGTNGVCFRAARCLTVASPSEDVVTTVTALGPPSESCEGNCLDATSYVWNTGSGVLDLKAVQNPTGTYTTKEFNANGLPTRIVYGDPDATPGGGEREMFLYYENSNFPGRVTEVRRQTSLSQDGGQCTSMNTANCTRTISTYDSNGLLSNVSQTGNTLSSSNAITSTTISTTYTYNSKGQVTQVDGANRRTVFEYWTSSDPFKDGFLQHYKRAKDFSSGFLTQSSLTYDFWGNPTSLLDADGTVSCQTFSATRGYLTQRREQMNGQSDCTPHASDIVTSWARDSALRLTTFTRPDGSCLIYEYATTGRLARTKRRDDCNPASAGDRQEYTYSHDGQLTKLETFDASNNVTHRQEMTYYDSRRLEKILNPVNPSKWTGLAYDGFGAVSEVTGGGGLSKTEYIRNAEGRVSQEKRFTAGSGFDAWNLLYDWIGTQLQVTDSSSIATKTVYDDFGRMVRLESPDIHNTSPSLPMLRLYDGDSLLTTIRENHGGSPAQHVFAYDRAGRRLTVDLHGGCSGTPVTETTYAYDAPPVTCPISGGCLHTNGRLAYIKSSLMCASSYDDKSLDQETFYSYDPAGRVIREYIRDDGGRVAEQAYTWTKIGALETTTMPSTALIGWTYGSGGNNSDGDLETAVWRTSTGTPIADTVKWFPYGPLEQYNQQNTASSTPLRTKIKRNLAYRTTAVEVEKQNDGSDVSSVTITEDDKGRVITRDYEPSNNVEDSYFRYDLQDRLLCETTAYAGSCPTSGGTTVKNSHSASPPFTAAGDWKTILRPIPGSGSYSHQFSLRSGTHQISSVAQEMGTTSYSYNQFGDRSSDDNNNLSGDLRTYTYDARHNVTNVRGNYKVSNTWFAYNVKSAYDAKNRRVYSHMAPRDSSRTLPGTSTTMPSIDSRRSATHQTSWHHRPTRCSSWSGCAIASCSTGRPTTRRPRPPSVTLAPTRPAAPSR